MINYSSSIGMLKNYVMVVHKHVYKYPKQTYAMLSSV